LPPSTESSKQSVAISSMERIERILAKICAAHLNVIVRRKGENMISVRGIAQAIGHSGTKSLEISNISPVGMAHLKTAREVIVEFKGMSTHLTFAQVIVEHQDAGVRIALPKQLYSLERRKNSRFKTTDENSAFLSVPSIGKSPATFGSPFAPTQLNNLNNWVRLADLSEGGICLVTRFPGILRHFRREHSIDDAALMLPMHTPIPVNAQVRWVKRVREMDEQLGEEAFRRKILIGLQFINPSEELTLNIRKFIRAMNLADAV
jgi:hypothetical protein